MKAAARKAFTKLDYTLIDSSIMDTTWRHVVKLTSKKLFENVARVTQFSGNFHEIFPPSYDMSCNFPNAFEGFSGALADARKEY